MKRYSIRPQWMLALGGFELLVLVALIRLGDEAYGVPIADAIEETSARSVSIGSVYITLERLEPKGLVGSRLGDPTPERGGRAKTASPQGTALFLIIALRGHEGHPPVPAPALLIILVFAVARPMSILLGGLIAADDAASS